MAERALMRFSDVEFIKCEEYNPYSEKANSLGMKTFWRADVYRETIAYGDTKKECIENARAAFTRLKERYGL